MRQRTRQRRGASARAAWRRWVIGLGLALSLTLAAGCASTVLGVAALALAAYVRSHP